ncbi:uncharacterized protein LOC109726649 isoform X1 [Ananas comosus]|uniref:Uncharacterized protein LOC109726649 isoform X1 n=1 Tax=Ananas comosus TaxID=4615 RepID=A0A6P5H1Q0_ANACO|nr:uncharacterized protein LOC109726649 isoform X1 [Ananas comosus]XP_020111990.1 uncharacterized protein LOC109726649 isoform X1 [Ananas comosus]XP_020112000.1 uncharacterized protein LOC109726649 isoform X1 [Ananas comosus]
MFENMPKTRFFPAMTSKDDLPISQKHQRDTVNNNNDDDASDKKNDNHLIGLRKRLSSFSVKIRPTSSASAEWAFRRTKSMTSITELAGGPLRRWWDWGLGWILSRRQAFARDIEMNEEETAILSCHSRGSWRHLFYKVRAEIRKLIGSNTLPTTHNFSTLIFVRTRIGESVIAKVYRMNPDPQQREKRGHRQNKTDSWCGAEELGFSGKREKLRGQHHYGPAAQVWKGLCLCCTLLIDMRRRSILFDFSLSFSWTSILNEANNREFPNDPILIREERENSK